MRVRADSGLVTRAMVSVLAVCAVAATLAVPRMMPRAELPHQLTDQEFWRLIEDASEPGGYFRAANITNLTSNELWFQHVIPDLVRRTRPGDVYLGVGPEQNFTYIAAVRPRMAIIFDIRRGNLDLQLMYKALFELAETRADFVSMLFAKPRPAGLGPESTADEIFSAFRPVTGSDALYRQTLDAMVANLTKTHGLPLPGEDRAGIEQVYQTFYWSGLTVRASPDYADLMTATDRAGVARSYLATEEGFRFLKDLEQRNLVVPVVGDFAGPKAIRAVGQYLRQRGATVSAFYLSNVEQYLIQDGKWGLFCRNVAALPLDETSTFIRSSGGRGRGFGGGGFVSTLGEMLDEVGGFACAGGRPGT
jgi:hypothetical protein